MLFTILPGLMVVAICAYYLIPEWVALEYSYQQYSQVAASSSSTLNELTIAKTAQEIHRINCFAEGVGLLLGGVIFSIGIHGIVTQASAKVPRQKHR